MTFLILLNLYLCISVVTLVEIRRRLTDEQLAEVGLINIVSACIGWPIFFIFVLWEVTRIFRWRFKR